MAERNDAGIAEDEIERQREQPPDRDFGKDQGAARQQPDSRERRDPEREFERTETGAGGERAGDGGFKLVLHGAAIHPGVARPRRSEPADAPRVCANLKHLPKKGENRRPAAAKRHPAAASIASMSSSERPK